jgi:hypothetical protein
MESKEILMEAEFEQHLRESRKEDLIELVKALALRHPALLTEISTLLDNLADSKSVQDDVYAEDEYVEVDEDEEETDEWDFGGDENVQLVPPPPGQLVLSPLESEAYRKRIESYSARLEQKEPVSTITSDLMNVLREAELRALQQDYYAALELYALVLDERLKERSAPLTAIFDEAIDAATPALETLLSEAGSNTMFDEQTITLSPLLTASARQSWLERLFLLWLKRVDAHNIDDELPEIMLNVAWDEDMPLLRALTQNELQKIPRSPHSNIVDFTRQFRYRALEKFLREISRV